MGPKPHEPEELALDSSSSSTASASPTMDKTILGERSNWTDRNHRSRSGTVNKPVIIAKEDDDDDDDDGAEEKKGEDLRQYQDNQSSSTTLVLQEDEEEAKEMSCEELYGPYPKAMPVPHINKNHDVPDPKIIASAETIYDVGASDHRDVGTPDEWLPRDGRLVRLTGRHPFNVEPPLSVHDEYKFLTPTTLQYVRNHGACPRLGWEDHTVCVGGPLAPRPLELTMDQIAAMEPRELPVTLVCAGNRRKEQNMIRQTIGFNWGPSGVSTSVWKGVPLRDLLLLAGVSEKRMAGKHVEFIGVEDLPNKVGPGPFVDEGEEWGRLVKYGTSIPLARAMNPAYDVLIAYEANGERLEPDHGFPVRLVIPGYIGGRMIKWLKHVNVISHETRNHYHYHDNRILPPHITAEQSLEEKWWYRPEYIFNELNINSAIARPDHNETINIKKMIGRDYEMTGYAYTGGGRMITRVEISTNGGVNWHLAELDRRERPTDHGMYWCWVWWKFDLPVADLIGCDELWVRAYDDANNMQPVSPTWNLMGMGNNQVFRVKVHVDRQLPTGIGGGGGEHVFRFEHPTQPGQETGGWMTRAVDKPRSAGFGVLREVLDISDEPSAASKGAESNKKGGQRTFTMAEVARHNSEDDVWIVVNNRVYDCTEYLDLHPGGADSIMINAGADATEDFVAIHSDKATKMLEKFYVGDVDALSSLDAKIAPDENTDKDGNKMALHHKRKIAFKLRKKIVLSHDSFMLDFALQTPKHVLGLPTGKHVFLSARINGEMVMRRYTPISSNFDVGCVKFVIKAYRPCSRFPRGGKMSQHLDSLAIGDAIDIRGPVGEFEYLSNGEFTMDGEMCHAESFNMVAGGTGITPVMQVAAEILRHPEDATQMSLIFACREELDLLMRSTLDAWAEKYPDKFKVHYILSDSWPKDWMHSTGFVSKSLFEEHFYPASSKVYNLMCGPPIMLEKGCVPSLVALGHAKTRMFGF